MILPPRLRRDSVTFAVSVTPKAAKDRIRNLSAVAGGGVAPKLIAPRAFRPFAATNSNRD